MVKLEAGSSPASVPNGASQSSPPATSATVKEESETKPVAAAAAAAAAAPYMYSTKVHIIAVNIITRPMQLHPSGYEGISAQQARFGALVVSSGSSVACL